MQIYLYALRKKNNITQKEMAEIIGVKTYTYLRKEQCKTQFTSNEMFKISEHFGLPIEQIFLPTNISISDKGVNKHHENGSNYVNSQ